MSKKKQKSSSQSTGTATTTPNVPGFITGPVSDYFGQVRGLMGTGPRGPSPLETEAFTGARGLLSDGTGSLAGTDLSPYMDPFEDEVVSRSLADIDRFRQGAISGNAAAATEAKAYGGSRHGVVDALTNRDFIDQAGLLASGLRSAGFRNAQDRAMADIDNRRRAIGLLSDLGQRERMSEAEWLRQIQGLLGIDPSAFVGQRIDQSGQSSGTQTQSGGLNFGFNWGPFSVGYG